MTLSVAGILAQVAYVITGGAIGLLAVYAAHVAAHAPV